ncbi:MAG: RNA polymerase sigma factor RpoD/SigA [Bacteroidales bacterium]|jgi:RNA polymerase primary sigma factor|nr:RNA polymerase sigma factor RpoD/SigA [Bacteroidales bacterium]MCK9499634.1 RNA polymerase sigma factor RpoD/SigA [Bacteroidales bacterium]MDY0315015.1 RNA polymerase sigma factor RpoD/SigA [Bacteroidales bacterium]NLB87462.1 RNA polymerase sigma factor RpoD/SigA [Bacteroidales bacterium]
MRQLKITRQVTNRDSLAFEMYLQEIAREKMISPQEEIELAKRIKNGDQEAVDELVRANLRFVISVAKQYQNQGLSLQDLVNEGNYGLIVAAKRFDETRGFKFISYAVWWIRQSVLHAIAVKGRIVRLPLNKIGMLNKIYSSSLSLEQKLEREPSLFELAEETELNYDKVYDTLKHQGKTLSMDAPLSNEDNDDFTLGDLIGVEQTPVADKNLIDYSLKIEINQVLNILGLRERTIIKMYYGLDGESPKTFEEISESLNLTKERVRQLKEAAIRKLKQSSKRNVLKSYLK